MNCTHCTLTVLSKKKIATSDTSHVTLYCPGQFTSTCSGVCIVCNTVSLLQVPARRKSSSGLIFTLLFSFCFVFLTSMFKVKTKKKLEENLMTESDLFPCGMFQGLIGAQFGSTNYQKRVVPLPGSLLSLLCDRTGKTSRWWWAAVIENKQSRLHCTGIVFLPTAPSSNRNNSERISIYKMCYSLQKLQCTAKPSCSHL